MGLKLSTVKHLFSRIDRLVHLASVKGIRRTVSVGFESYVFAYRRYSLCYDPLGTPPFPAEENSFHCQLANMNDVEPLKVFEPYRRRRQFREWLSNGSFVFMAFDGELPVAFNVASTAPFFQPPFSRIPLEEHQIWAVDAYTLPSHRRRHAARALANYKYRFLAAKGFQESVSFKRIDNEPVVAMWARREDYRLTYLRILFFSKTWLESTTQDNLSAPASSHPHGGQAG